MPANVGDLYSTLHLTWQTFGGTLQNEHPLELPKFELTLTVVLLLKQDHLLWDSSRAPDERRLQQLVKVRGSTLQSSLPILLPSLPTFPSARSI